MTTEKMVITKKVIFFISISVVLLPNLVEANFFKKEKEAIDLIVVTANQMCTEIPLETIGTKQQLTVKGEMTLSNLFSRIANIGFSGSGEHSERTTRGIIEEDLQKAVANSDKCKANILEELKDVFLSPRPEPEPEVDTREDGKTTTHLNAIYYDHNQGHMRRDQSSIDGNYVSYINPDQWFRFDLVDFGKNEKSTFHARVASKTNGGIISVRADTPDGGLLSSCPVGNTGGWEQWVTVNCEMEFPMSGERTIYFVFEGPKGYLFNINWLEFRSKPIPLR